MSLPPRPDLTFVRPMYGPDHPKGPTVGPDVLAWKRVMWRWDARIFPGPALEFDDVYNRRIANATRAAQRYWKIYPSGNVGKATFDRSLRALRDRGAHRPLESAWDAVAESLYRRAGARVPPAHCHPIPRGVAVTDLGGVAAHQARPLGNWQSDNAVDIGAPPRTLVLAPKAGWVSRIGGTDPQHGPVGTIFGEHVTISCPDNDAFFLTHLDRIVGVGERVVAGQIIAREIGRAHV